MVQKCRSTRWGRVGALILLSSVFWIVRPSSCIAASAEGNLKNYQNTSNLFELSYPFKWRIETYNSDIGIFAEGFNLKNEKKITVESSNQSCSDIYGGGDAASTNGCKSIRSKEGSVFPFINLSVDVKTGLWHEVYDSFKAIDSVAPVTIAQETQGNNQSQSVNTEANNSNKVSARLNNNEEAKNLNKNSSVATPNQQPGTEEKIQEKTNTITEGRVAGQNSAAESKNSSTGQWCLLAVACIISISVIAVAVQLKKKKKI